MNQASSGPEIPARGKNLVSDQASQHVEAHQTRAKTMLHDGAEAAAFSGLVERKQYAAQKPESVCFSSRFITRFSLVQGLLPLRHRLYLGLHGLRSDPVCGGRPMQCMEQLAHDQGLRHGLQACVLQRMEQARQGSGLRRHRAEKPSALCIGHQQRRKSFDIDVAHQVSLVFHIEPDKSEGWMALGQLHEDGLVVTANAAPAGAQANDPGHLKGSKRLGGG